MAATVIAPSLLAGDFARLGEEVAALDKAGADWLHLDIMDGHFVPNISFGPGLVKAVRSATKMPFDLHLMIAPADPYLAAFRDAGADHITIHPEAGAHPHRTLQSIRALGAKTGLALDPATPVEHAFWALDLIDLILVMTVNPGFGGQAFLPSMLPKISAVRKMIGDRPIRLQVDGGITTDTAKQVIAAGADTLVAGTSVFHAPDYAAAVTALRGL